MNGATRLGRRTPTARQIEVLGIIHAEHDPIAAARAVGLRRYDFHCHLQALESQRLIDWEGPGSPWTLTPAGLEALR